jgi:hypothetical protein
MAIMEFFISYKLKAGSYKLVCTHLFFVGDQEHVFGR